MLSQPSQPGWRPGMEWAPVFILAGIEVFCYTAGYEPVKAKILPDVIRDLSRL